MKSRLPSHKEISKRKFAEGYIEKKNCILCIPFILSGSPNDGLQSGIKLLRHGNFGEQNSIYLSCPSPLHSKLGCCCFLQVARTAAQHNSMEGPRGGGYSWEFLVGLCSPVLQILTLFQTKRCNFPHPFSDQTSKIHTRFQNWPLRRNYVIIT